MALVVEDGTGVSGANTYVNETDADTYWTAHGNPSAWSGASSADKETALIAAAEYLETKNWMNSRALSTQLLAWPRVNMYFDGHSIASTVVPTRVVNAQTILALRYISDTSLWSDVTAADQQVKVQREKLGPLETETVFHGAQASQKVYSEVEALIQPWVTSGSEVFRG